METASRMVLAAAAAACMGAAAMGQSGGATRPDDRAGMLGGPVVKEKPKAATLVEYDFNGALRRPETTPEEAAAALLDLSGAARDSVAKVFADQAAVLDRIVAENLDLFGQLDTASKAGDKAGQLRLGMILVERTRPLREGGLLRERVAAALPADAAAEFGRLLDEYWSAVLAEGKSKPKEDGKKPGWFEVAVQERAQVFLKEIERSYLRQATMGTLYLDAILKGLDLSPAQRERLRGLAIDLAQRTDFKPTEKQQEMLVVGAIAYLTPAQRDIVLKRVRGEYVEPDAPPKSASPAASDRR